VLYMPRCFSGPMKITFSSRGNRALRRRPRWQRLQLGHELVDDGNVVAVAEPVDQAEGLDVRLLHQVLQLVDPVGRVHGDRDHADLGRGKEQCEPVRDIGGPDPRWSPFFRPMPASPCEPVDRRSNSAYVNRRFLSGRP